MNSKIVALTAVFIGITSLLSGCSVTGDDMFSKMREVFEVEIFEDDSKRFSYMFISRVRGVNLSGTTSRDDRSSQGARRSQRVNPENIKKPFLKRLESKLAETGFCREGYMELSYSTFATQVELIGECHESASSEDKALWGKTLSSTKFSNNLIGQ